MALLEKQQYQRRNRRRVYKKRQRTGLFVFIALVVLTLVAWMFLGTDDTAEETAVVGRVSDPTVAEAPEVLSEEESDEASDEEEVLVDEAAGEGADEDEVAPVPPADTTLRLSVPALGVSDAVVLGGDVGLEAGAQHVSGYPWQDGANTYIAGHRIGFPGTGSDHIFYNLPSLGNGAEIFLTDALGQTYTYRVSEVFAVSPTDLWVLDSVPGRDTISLQVCTETPDDWFTIGPSLFGGGPESGRLIVRGDLV